MSALVGQDEHVLARCRAGEAEAWAAIVEHYSRYVWAIALRGYRLNTTDAEDVVQEAFVRLHRNIDTVHGETLQPWLAQVARRLCVDVLRRQQREEVVEEVAETHADDSLQHLDRAMDVRAAMLTLPEHCRDILDRFFARDESYELIARQLRVPQGTIASRISRCLGRLRAELQDREMAPA